MYNPALVATHNKPLLLLLFKRTGGHMLGVIKIGVCDNPVQYLPHMAIVVNYK